MLSRVSRTCLRQSSRAMSTIPVNHVARIVRMHVENEEEAMKADVIFQRGLDLFKSADAPAGMVSAKRTVCKAEWAYEVEMIFEGDKFKDYMESDFREQKAAPVLADLTKLATGEIYSGNRVVDWYEL